jgi:4-amino-4-deoxy-L-arabinose transferase-like glycosyltransferase
MTNVARWGRQKVKMPGIRQTLEYKCTLLGLALLALATMVFAGFLSVRVIPIGEGPDELSHLSHALYKYKYGSDRIDNRSGLTLPAVSPSGQGHQPPLYYWMGRAIFSLFIERNEIPGSLDFALGLKVAADNHLLGGDTRCTYSQDTEPASYVPYFWELRYAVYSYRILSAMLAVGTMLLCYIVVRSITPRSPLVALAAAAFMMGIPTATWRASIVNNDNAVVFFSSLTCFIGFLFIRASSEQRMHWYTVALAASASASFLSKYTGVAAIGMGAIAIILRHSTIRQKLSHFSLFAGLTFAMVAADLWENLKFDGDILSAEVVKEVVPALFKPSSYVAVATNFEGLREMWRRYWLTFHNPGTLDPAFNLNLFSLWEAASVISVLAILFARLLPQSKESLPNREFLYLLGSTIGVVVVWIHFATSYPIACGRYVHPNILPYSALTTYSIYSGLRWLGERAAKFTCIALAICFVFLGWGVTYTTLTRQFTKCIHSSPNDLALDVEVVPANLIEGAATALIFASKYENQMFVLEQSSRGQYRWNSGMTRKVTLMHNQVHVGDLNGDGFSELILWFARSGLVSYLDGRTIRPLDDQKYPKASSSDFARYRPFEKMRGWEMQVTDTNFDGLADIVWHSRQQKKLVVFRTKPARKFLEAKGEISTYPLTEDLGHFVLLKIAGRQFIGMADAGNAYSLLSLDGQFAEAATLNIAPQEEVYIVDTDFDGSDELFVAGTGDSCAKKYILGFNAERKEVTHQLAGELCVGSLDLSFTPRVRVFAIKRADGRAATAVLDRLAVRLFALHEGGWQRISTDWF